MAENKQDNVPETISAHLAHIASPLQSLFTSGWMTIWN